MSPTSARRATPSPDGRGSDGPDAEANPLSVEHVGGVSRVVWNRPPLNLMTEGLLTQLLATLEALARRRATRVVVLTGAGTRAFCAGADLGEEATADEAAAARLRRVGRSLVERIETLPQPVIAALFGWCIGAGTALAIPCDLRVAADTTVFRFPEVQYGMSPSWGLGMVRLVHYLGRNRTLDTFLLGQDLSAARAYEYGLVTEVVSASELASVTTELAHRLAAGAPLAIRAIREGVRAQYWDGPAAATTLEDAWHERVHTSRDRREGMVAYRERRPPRYTGR